MSTPTLITTGPSDRLGVLQGGTRSIIPNWQPVQKTPIAPASRESLAQASDTFERQVMVAAQNEPCRVTYGTDRLGAQLANVLGYGNGVLAICLWGRGEVQNIGSLTLGNAPPPATVLATHYTGTTGQLVDGKLVTAFAAMGITHAATLAGIAYSVVELQVGADIGDIAAIVQGVKIYDPRDGTQTLGTPSTYKWSDNPALALADLITNTTYGWGQSIDWTSVAAAANACDALVSGEKKRTIGITIDTRRSAEEWVEVLRAHAGCYVVRSGATFKLVPDATASSIKTFGKTALVDGSVQWSMRPIDQRPNVVEVRYTDTTVTPWQVRSAVYPTNGLPPSGQELRLSRREMTGVQRYSQAIREAIELINHCELEALTQQWDSYLDATSIEPGDVVTVNDGGLTGGITFRVLTREWVEKGVWRFRGQKYDAAAFNSSALAAPTTGNTTLPSASTPPTIASVTLSENVEAPGVGGAPSSSISATCPAITTWPFLSGYVWYVYDDAANLVEQGTTVGNSWRTRALPAPQRYTVYVKARSSIAIASTHASAQITLSGSTQSLTPLTSTRVFAAGATLVNYEAYTLYPGDPYLRVAPIPGSSTTFGGQFATDAISAATPNVLSHNRFLVSQYRTDTYAKSAAIDLGASKTVVCAIAGAPTPNAIYLMLGFEAATSLAGPWTFAQGTVCTLTGRYVRLVVAPRDAPPSITLPDGGAGLGTSPYSNQYDRADFGAAVISLYGATVEETGSVTTSVSGPVTVTLSGTYAALRDLQATPLDGNGTVVVAVNNPGPSPTAINTFEINATVDGARVAVPVRWNFKGAV